MDIVRRQRRNNIGKVAIGWVAIMTVIITVAFATRPETTRPETAVIETGVRTIIARVNRFNITRVNDPETGNVCYIYRKDINCVPPTR